MVDNSDMQLVAYCHIVINLFRCQVRIYYLLDANDQKINKEITRVTNKYIVLCVATGLYLLG